MSEDPWVASLTKNSYSENKKLQPPIRKCECESEF